MSLLHGSVKGREIVPIGKMRKGRLITGASFLVAITKYLGKDKIIRKRLSFDSQPMKGYSPSRQRCPVNRSTRLLLTLRSSQEGDSKHQVGLSSETSRPAPSGTVFLTRLQFLNIAPPSKPSAPTSLPSVQTWACMRKTIFKAPRSQTKWKSHSH